MKQAVALVASGPCFVRSIRLAAFGAVASGFAACSLAGPPPAKYVLGSVPVPAAANVIQTQLPVVELKRVQFPDYLDTTDILERRGNQLVPRSAGRWGERLPIGMTRALAASLAARLPNLVLTTTPSAGRPARQVLVDVSSFEPRADSQVVLVARWAIVDATRRQVLVAEQTSLVKPIAGPDDNAVVAAMSHAIDDLALQLAASIQKSF